MKEKKYELIKDDSIEIGEHALYRIRALRNFCNVKKGDLGGYIEDESCLSQEGNCWVFNNAKVFIPIKISGNTAVDSVVDHDPWDFPD